MKDRSAVFAFLLLFSACTALESQSEFAAGRRALLRGEPDNALAYFERVATDTPGFVTDTVLPPRSVWTYIGRAHYNAGRYEAAESAFEKALSYRREDNLARMYWALTLLRPAPPPMPSTAFNLQEVTYALREGVEPRRVAALARERGVAFDLTQETESQLRHAGADSFLMNELKKLRSESVKGMEATEARARSQTCTMVVAKRRNCSPAGVSFAPALLRMNTGRSSRSSSTRMRALTAVCVR